MLPALLAAIAEAGPVVLLPVTVVVGFVGYKIENFITTNRKDNQLKSVIVSQLYFLDWVSMWIYAMRSFANRVAPIIMLPVTITVGFIGTIFEDLLGRSSQPQPKSVYEMRDERNSSDDALREATNVPTLKSRAGIPKSSLYASDATNH